MVLSVIAIGVFVSKSERRTRRNWHKQQWPFDDERLPELLFRYRARNFPDTLSSEEQQRWRIFCQKRLSAPEWGAPNTLETFVEAAAQLSATATSFQRGGAE